MSTTQMTNKPRWSKVTLMLDGCLFALIAVGQAVVLRQSYVDGAGPFGATFKGSPYAVGMIGTLVLVGVIGIGLISASVVAPQRIWHAFGALAHVSLFITDLSVLPMTRELVSDVSFVYVELTFHVVFVTAHAIGFARLRTGTTPGMKAHR